MMWQQHDPTWLVALAREQCLEHPWLPPALSRCTLVYKHSRAYWYFVDPDSDLWRFESNVQLYDKREGELVLDILEGRIVGGVEFLARI